jgi:hypothetical protein
MNTVQIPESSDFQAIVDRDFGRGESLEERLVSFHKTRDVNDPCLDCSLYQRSEPPAQNRRTGRSCYRT